MVGRLVGVGAGCPLHICHITPMVCHLEAVSEGRAQAEMATITTMIRRAHSHPTGPPLAKDWMAAEPFAAFELLWSSRGAQLFMVLRGLAMRQKREFQAR